MKQSDIRYFVYARKSSESEDRQVQSVDDQLHRLKELAKDQGLKIVDVFHEAKSAKKPNNRPEFSRMIEEIEHGKADGVLCWQINRLSRNPVDSGRLQWMLQNEVLKSIRTYEKEYLPSDNALLFSVESGIANQFILDLRKNTMRGTLSKLEKGWQPNCAPIGYLNDKETKTIVIDPERFDLVRKMWDLMLTGNYTPPQIMDIANNDWGMRTRKSKNMGGKTLSRSLVYRIFNNPFYMGIIQYAGKEFEGKHTTMITEEEFNAVQYILGKKGKPRPKTREFAFTGAIRCGECGCAITAQTKTKHIKSTNEVKSYTYYHCTRRKKGYKCSQRNSVSETKLEAQIEKEISKLTILPEFREWALSALQEAHGKEVEDRSKIYEQQQEAIADTQKQLDNLTSLRIRDLIDDKEYAEKRDELKADIRKLKRSLNETENRAEKWLELTEKTFDFATYAHSQFLTGDLQTKKQILLSLGNEATLLDGVLTIQTNEWFKVIENAYPALEAQYLALEPSKTPLNKQKTNALNNIRSLWYPGRDSNPHAITDTRF